MDGLLVDSEPLWFVVEREVMARLGGQWGEADQQALIGGSLERTVSWLLAKATRPVTASRADVARWLVDGMARLVAERGLAAREVLLPAARLVGGGAGGKGELATAGGRDPSRLADALALAAAEARRRLEGPGGSSSAAAAPRSTEPAGGSGGGAPEPG